MVIEFFCVGKTNGTGSPFLASGKGSFYAAAIMKLSVHGLVGVGLLAVCCSGAGTQQPEAESPQAEPSSETEGADSTSAVSGWSDVAETSTDSRSVHAAGTGKGKVTVRSDPNQHVEELTFEFWVDGTQLDGVFTMPTGEDFTFTLPGGTVDYRVAQCGGGGGSFELSPGARVVLLCAASGQQECCNPEEAADGERSPQK